MSVNSPWAPLPSVKVNVSAQVYLHRIQDLGASGGNSSATGIPVNGVVIGNLTPGIFVEPDTGNYFIYPDMFWDIPPITADGNKHGFIRDVPFHIIGGSGDSLFPSTFLCFGTAHSNRLTGFNEYLQIGQIFGVGLTAYGWSNAHSDQFNPGDVMILSPNLSPITVWENPINPIPLVTRPYIDFTNSDLPHIAVPIDPSTVFDCGNNPYAATSPYGNILVDVPGAIGDWYTNQWFLGGTSAGINGVQVFGGIGISFPHGMPYLPQADPVPGDGTHQWQPDPNWFQPYDFSTMPDGYNLYDINIEIHVVLPTGMTGGSLRRSQPPVTQVVDEHFLRGAISLPTGSGSPRLYAAASHTRSTKHVISIVRQASSGPGGIFKTSWLDSEASTRIDSSSLKAAVSLDFGHTWQKGVEVGMKAQDGTDLSDGRECSDTVNFSGYAQSSSYDITRLVNTHIVPISMICHPSGKIFVRAFIATYDPFTYYADTNNMNAIGNVSFVLPALNNKNTAAPRVTEIATMVLIANPSSGQRTPAFRDAHTPNQLVTAFDQWGRPVPNSSLAQPSLEWHIWQSSGAYPGTRGQGGQSQSPQGMYLGAYDSAQVTTLYVSRDGGDTWVLDPNYGHTQFDYIRGRDQFISKGGRVDSGVTLGSNEILPSNYLLSYWGSTIHTADGYTMGVVVHPGRTVGNSVNPGSTDMTVILGIAGSVAGALPFIPNTPRPTYAWQMPNAAEVDDYIIWQWGSRFVALHGAGGVITSYVSDDSGKTWAATVQSTDNMTTWQKAS